MNNSKLKLKKENNGSTKYAIAHHRMSRAYPTRCAILVEMMRQRVQGMTRIIIMRELVLALISSGAPLKW